MNISENNVLDILKENGGISTSYGEVKNRSPFFKKTGIIVTSSIVATAISASFLYNHMHNDTGNTIQKKISIVQPDSINNMMNNNFIVMHDISEGKYGGLNIENNNNEKKELTVDVDHKNIRSIFNYISANHLIKKDTYIPQFNITVNKNDTPDLLQQKLLYSANNSKNEDVRVRAKTMVFIISNEGLSSGDGLDAQNHFTLGYGYDVNEQIKSLVATGQTKEEAKKNVYIELAKSGIDTNELIKAYNGKGYKITITPAQATILSSKTIDNYLSYAKKSAGPKLWGLIKGNDVKPADFNFKDWTVSSLEQKGGYFNNYMVMDDRMKAAYVYSVYNAGPKALGNKVKLQLEKGNYYSAINAISITWKDKHGIVHKNYRLMNNMAFAFSSDKTMQTFISNDSDKYAKTEISQALSSESPDIEKMLKLREMYNKNITIISSYDIKKMKGETLNYSEHEKYEQLVKQSDGLLKNINELRNNMGEKPIEGYSASKNITNFDKLKEESKLAATYNDQFYSYSQGVLNAIGNVDEKTERAYLNKDGFEPSKDLSERSDFNEIKKIALQQQNEKIKNLTKKSNPSLK